MAPPTVSIVVPTWNRAELLAETIASVLDQTFPDFELLVDFNRDIAYKVLWSVVRLLCARLRVTNDNLRSFLAMSMF